jgi:hypothetical protein
LLHHIWLDPSMQGHVGNSPIASPKSPSNRLTIASRPGWGRSAPLIINSSMGFRKPPAIVGPLRLTEYRMKIRKR